MSSDGNHEFTLGQEYRKLYWFELDQIGQYFRNDVNDNQESMLSAEDRATFLQQARTSMEHFGYLEPELARGSNG